MTTTDNATMTSAAGEVRPYYCDCISHEAVNSDDYEALKALADNRDNAITEACRRLKEMELDRIALTQKLAEAQADIHALQSGRQVLHDEWKAAEAEVTTLTSRLREMEGLTQWVPWSGDAMPPDGKYAVTRIQGRELVVEIASVQPLAPDSASQWWPLSFSNGRVIAYLPAPLPPPYADVPKLQSPASQSREGAADNTTTHIQD